MMTIAAEWFADRLRQGVGLGPPSSASGCHGSAQFADPCQVSSHPTSPLSLPSATAGLDPTLIHQLLRTAREAEAQIDANIHVQLTLTAATTQWEKALRSS